MSITPPCSTPDRHSELSAIDEADEFAQSSDNPTGNSPRKSSPMSTEMSSNTKSSKRTAKGQSSTKPFESTVDQDVEYDGEGNMVEHETVETTVDQDVEYDGEGTHDRVRNRADGGRRACCVRLGRKW